MITLKDVENNEKVKRFIINSQRQLDELGYTEHSTRHAKFVALLAGDILKSLGYDDHMVNLAEIAGYIHDIGNAVNRNDHALTGATLAYHLLLEMGMDNTDAAEVMMAVGNHDEKTGTPVSEISSAVILADKADVHKSRVRNKDKTRFDIHDRVNYSVQSSKVVVNNEEKIVSLRLIIDTEITQIMDYFEIFTYRMMLSKKAAEFLGAKFELIINDNKIL